MRAGEIPVLRQVPSSPTQCHNLTHMISKRSTHLSKNGKSSGAPGVLRQSRMSSHAIANIERTCTPAARMRSFASSAVLTSNVPEASLLAYTV